MIQRTRGRSPLLTPLICMIVLSVSVALLVAGAASASAPRSSSGGTGIGGSGTSGTGNGGSPGAGTTTNQVKAPVINVGMPVAVTGNGITISTSRSGLQGKTITFRGSVPVADAPYAVAIRYATAANPGAWQQATTATPDASGHFLATWTAGLSGRVSFAATVLNGAAGGSSGDGGTTFTTATTTASPASDTANGGPSTPALTVTIFRSAVATLYGPGLWGHRTACGQRLGRATLGIASRTLKCGTQVAVYYHGHEIVVAVIDRGPFSNHATWDLTEATARALGITQTGTIGTLLQSPGQ